MEAEGPGWDLWELRAVGGGGGSGCTATHCNASPPLPPGVSGGSERVCVCVWLTLSI